MTLIAVQSPIRDVRDANSRERFESWARAKGYNLSPLLVNGQFHHYLTRDTDDAWMGYCEATRQAREIAFPAIRDLLRKQCGHM